MKNIYFKILNYTLILLVVISAYKIFIQNQYFVGEQTTISFLMSFIFKISLFILTLFFLKIEKINWYIFNKNKYTTSIVAILILLIVYNDVLSQSVIQKINLNYLKLTFYTLTTLFIGLFEEFYFRIFIFILFCKYYKENLFKASIITSLLFAFVHLNNLISKDYDFQSVMYQIMFAFALGIFFQLLVINLKNIYVAVLIHFYIDFQGGLMTGFFNIPSVETAETGFNYITLFVSITLVLVFLTVSYFNLKN